MRPLGAAGTGLAAGPPVWGSIPRRTCGPPLPVYGRQRHGPPRRIRAPRRGPGRLGTGAASIRRRPGWGPQAHSRGAEQRAQSLVRHGRPSDCPSRLRTGGCWRPCAHPAGASRPGPRTVSNRERGTVPCDGGRSALGDVVGPVSAGGGNDVRVGPKVIAPQLTTSRRANPHAPISTPATPMTTAAITPLASHTPTIGWPKCAVSASWWTQSGSLRGSASRSTR